VIARLEAVREVLHEAHRLVEGHLPTLREGRLECLVAQRLARLRDRGLVNLALDPSDRGGDREANGVRGPEDPGRLLELPLGDGERRDTFENLTDLAAVARFPKQVDACSIQRRGPVMVALTAGDVT
jgi:hypothetical protein